MLDLSKPFPRSVFRCPGANPRMLYPVVVIDPMLTADAADPTKYAMCWTPGGWESAPIDRTILVRCPHGDLYESTDDLRDAIMARAGAKCDRAGDTLRRVQERKKDADREFVKLDSQTQSATWISLLEEKAAEVMEVVKRERQEAANR